MPWSHEATKGSCSKALGYKSLCSDSIQLETWASYPPLPASVSFSGQNSQLGPGLDSFLFGEASRCLEGLPSFRNGGGGWIHGGRACPEGSPSHILIPSFFPY